MRLLIFSLLKLIRELKMVMAKGQVEAMFCTSAFQWWNWGKKICSYKLLSTCFVHACAIEMSANCSSINSMMGPQNKSKFLHSWYSAYFQPILPSVPTQLVSSSGECVLCITTSAFLCLFQEALFSPLTLRLSASFIYFHSLNHLFIHSIITMYI